MHTCLTLETAGEQHEESMGDGSAEREHKSDNLTLKIYATYMTLASYPNTRPLFNLQST